MLAWIIASSWIILHHLSGIAVQKHPITFKFLQHPSHHHFSLSCHHSLHHPSKTHNHRKSSQRRQDTFSLTSWPPLGLSHHGSAWCNISVSDMRCISWVNSCWLLLWAMLWGKATITGAETDRRGAPDLLPPEHFLWLWNPLRHISTKTKWEK